MQVQHHLLKPKAEPQRRAIRMPKQMPESDFKIWAERRNRRILRLTAVRDLEPTAADVLEKQLKNKQLIKTVRAAHYTAAGQGAGVVTRSPRWNHPAIAPPNLPHLNRSHLTPLIVLMILLWAGIMAFGIYKGMTPPNGMRISWDY